MSAAPADMIASGFGDTIGKLTSRIDWKLSNLITGMYYCPVMVDLVNEAADLCVNTAESIGRRDAQAIEGLTEALIMSGMAMMLAGDSSPASGSEHNLSHYWEMKAQVTGGRKYFHGTKVGVATTVMALFGRRFFARDPATVDREAVRAGRQSLASIELALKEALGAVAEPTIASVSRPAYLDWEGQQFQIDALQKKWPEIQSLSELLPDPEQVIRTLRAVHAPALPREIDVSPDLLRETLLLAKEIRGKYTLLRAAETLGWLDEIVDEVVSDVQSLT
jgi:glycerol-1-phosphate dehydrogenase [NAD(P)+]